MQAARRDRAPGGRAPATGGRRGSPRGRLLALAAVSALVATAPRAGAGDLDAAERAMVAEIDRAEPAARALLEELVNINSGTMNFAGVKAVGMRLKAEFEADGFAAEWVEGAAFGRAGHLVVSGGGDRGPKVLMIGHLDTVFAKHDAFQRFEPVAGDRVKGPGITDMKGGDVIMLHALRALKAAGVLDRLRFKVVITGDEEHAGSPLAAAKKALTDVARWADYAVGFEDGDGDPKTAVVSRRGATSWQVEVTGRPAHSSQVFSAKIGDGAIYEAARILNGFRETLAGVPDLTFNPGVIAGGTRAVLDAGSAEATAFGKTNVVAQTATIRGDIRAISPAQLEMARGFMRRIVAASLPGTQATIRFEKGYPPMAPTDGNRRLLKLYDGASRDLGFGPVVAVKPINAGAADVSFCASLVDAAIDGLGLMGEGGHTIDEVADMKTLASQTKRAALFLYRLAGADAGRYSP